MKAAITVMVLSSLLVLSGCAGMRDSWSGKKAGTNGSATAGSMSSKSSTGAMNGAAGNGSVGGDESSIGNGSGTNVGNKALDRGTGNTR